MDNKEIEKEMMNDFIDYDKELIDICLNCKCRDCTGGINCAYEEKKTGSRKKGGLKRGLYSEDAVRMAKEGKSYVEIAEIFGVSPSTVRQWCKDSGMPPKRMLKGENSDIRKEKIMQLYNEGYTYREIAIIIGISKSYAKTLAKEAGAPPRYQKRK